MNRFEIIFVCNVFQVLFDALGCLRKYESPLDILKEFFELRLEKYAVRKAWLDGMLTAESTKLSSQARFILEKIEGQIIIGEGSIIAHYLFIYSFHSNFQLYSCKSCAITLEAHLFCSFAPESMAVFVLETLKLSKTLKLSQDDFNVLDNFNVSSINASNELIIDALLFDPLLWRSLSIS